MSEARNPWLDIPLADYEGHMALPAVGQAQLLADALGAAVRDFAPRSVAVLGCAGGNGFERIPSDTRVVGIDINRAYLDELERRFAARLPRLELVAADVGADELPVAPVELVFAGLLFEYVDPGRALDRIADLVAEGGSLVSVLQAPNATIAEVTPTEFASLAALSGRMRLVEPSALATLARQHGFTPSQERVLVAAGGKRFTAQRFTRSAPL